MGAKVLRCGYGRRGSGDDAIYFDHSGDCRDERLHKSCAGRWRGAVSLGYGPDGQRIRRKVSGQIKQDVKDKLGKLHSDLEAGVRAPIARYTVAQAVEDWLAMDWMAVRRRRSRSTGRSCSPSSIASARWRCGS